MACDLILQSCTWITIKSVFSVDYVVDPSQKVKMNHFFSVDLPDRLYEDMQYLRTYKNGENKLR